jgi:hypothetical protein
MTKGLLSTRYRYSAPFSVTMSRRPGSWSRGRDLHRPATNIPTQTYDVHRFGFELAGALELLNEYSGNAACRLSILTSPSSGTHVSTADARGEVDHECAKRWKVYGFHWT